MAQEKRGKKLNKQKGFELKFIRVEQHMVLEWVVEIAVLRMRPHSIQSMKNVTVAQFNQEIKRVKIEFSTLNNIL